MKVPTGEPARRSRNRVVSRDCHPYDTSQDSPKKEIAVAQSMKRPPSRSTSTPPTSRSLPVRVKLEQQCGLWDISPLRHGELLMVHKERWGSLLGEKKTPSRRRVLQRSNFALRSNPPSPDQSDSYLCSAHRDAGRL